MVQFSHPYMTTGKTIALTIRTSVSKVMFLFYILSRFVIYNKLWLQRTWGKVLQWWNLVKLALGEVGWTWLILVSSGYMHRSWDTSVSFNFGFLRVYAQEWDCWGKQWFYSQFFFFLFCFVLFFKESPYRLPQWLQQFTFPPTVQEGSLLSTPFPAFIVCRLFHDGHSDSYEMISLYFLFAFL